jgi:hypothetical protein
MGDEIRRMNQSFALLREAYEVGPYHMPPEQLVAQLKEIDPWMLSDLVVQMQYDIIGGLGAIGYSDAERIRAVDESLRMFRYDVITEFGYGLWTNFGFGNGVKVVPNDDKAKEVWYEFWKADRNAAVLGDDSIHELSDTVLSQGELFLIVYCSDQDGEATIRVLGDAEHPGTKQITEIVYNPDDESMPLYYKREWTDSAGVGQTLYYADWQAWLSDNLDESTLSAGKVLDKAKLPVGAKKAEETKPGTVVIMFRIARNRKGSKRGWPLMTAGAPWSRSHKKFREDRATVAAAFAMFVHKLNVKGGSRAVSALRTQLASAFQTNPNASCDTNPPPTAGSTWIQNEAADLTRLPMGTGASDAKEDGDALLRMAGLGVGIYPQWLGVGDTNALATAKSMEQPMSRQFSRYQTFWAAQWRKLVIIVLSMAEKYDGKTFEDKTAEVSTDKLVQTDLGGIVTAIAPLIMQTIAAIEKSQVEGAPLASILGDVWALALDALGIEDIVAVSPQAFGAQPIQAAESGASHVAQQVNLICPLCGNDTALFYPGHGDVVVCESCGQTYDRSEAVNTLALEPT